MKQKGSFTVEASIVFPTIFLVILAILWMSMAYCQNIMAASAAMRAASRAASGWEYAGGRNPSLFRSVETAQGLITADSFTDHDPYRYLFDTGNKGRISNTKDYADKLIGALPGFVEEKSGNHAEVKKTGGMLQKYIEVTIKKEYINPLQKVFENYGLQPQNDRSITAKTPLNNPGEFMRNVSIIYDALTDDTLLD